jgi:hypothetical protein
MVYLNLQRDYIEAMYGTFVEASSVRSKLVPTKAQTGVSVAWELEDSVLYIRLE